MHVFSPFPMHMLRSLLKGSVVYIIFPVTCSLAYSVVCLPAAQTITHHSDRPGAVLGKTSQRTDE